jgi:cytochrome c oxidase subunit IV
MTEQNTDRSGGSGSSGIGQGEGLPVGSAGFQPGGRVGSAGGSPPPGEDHGLAHVLPRKVLLAVFGGLVVLTWVTVAATWVDLGAGNLWLAMGIATVKGLLVALFFMHLRWDRPINAVIFIGALLFVLLFVGMALTDSSSYLPDMIPGYAPGMPQ